jgi:hypothetical protein
MVERLAAFLASAPPAGRTEDVTLDSVSGTGLERRVAVAAEQALARRSAAGRSLDETAITLAVVSAVRHEDTAYDKLLMSGVARDDAREQIKDTIASVLATWAQDDPSPVRQQAR